MKVTRHNSIALPPMTQNPAKEASKSAEETASESDARGRVIEVGRLNALQYYRLTKAMGASANNVATMELASIACSVRSIDGDPVDFPSTELQIEHLIQRLDFDGFAAVASALAKLKGDADAGIDAAKN